MYRFNYMAIMALSSLAAACSGGSAVADYPAAPKDTTVSDTYFGMTVADPFRPLEDDTSAVTTAWVKAENEVSRAYLDAIPFREAVKERLTSLNNYTKSGVPTREKDGRYYYYENDGLQNQSVLYRADSIGARGEVFLDPNALSTDGTVALTGVFPSNDGKYTAYTVSRNGSDWSEIYVMDTETKALLPDHIEWAKFTDAAWAGDGFFYSAYPRPETGKEFSSANENHQIYFHKLGTGQSADKLVYEDPAHPLHFHTAYVPESEDWLFVIGQGEGVGSSVMARSLKGGNGEWRVLEPSQDYRVDIVDVRDGKALIVTNADAPRGRLVAADLSSPARSSWQEVIPQGEGVMKSVSPAGSKLLVSFEQDAADKVVVYDRAGNSEREIKLPTFGSVALSSSPRSDEVFYSFTSFTYPSAVYSYDMAADSSALIKQPAVEGFNSADYVTEQVFYPSADGTKIPMFITYKKGLRRDGNNPVLLYGYGGFNISLTPGFNANRLLWLENGGIYAQANLRGGSEYGEEWHTAGTKLQKPNVFNDFIAAAEYLIRENWTKPELLAINGGSNGGLLIGAVTNMRPELFKVAVPQVGVMDMMRYHLFTIGWNWASDYGTSADSKEMAKCLLGYSPLHNIRNDGTPYPAILVTTGDHDDRVVPAHSFKYAATLQASDTGDAPKLIRIDTNAGHGAGKPMAKVLDEQADIYSFIFKNLGIEPKTGK